MKIQFRAYIRLFPILLCFALPVFGRLLNFCAAYAQEYDMAYTAMASSEKDFAKDVQNIFFQKEMVTGDETDSAGTLLSTYTPGLLPSPSPTKVPVHIKISSNPFILLFICMGIAAAGAIFFILTHWRQNEIETEIVRNMDNNFRNPDPDIKTEQTLKPVSEKNSVIIKEGAYVIASCKGRGKRDHQEDALWFSENAISGEPVCAVIADGMGGMENGAESSAKVIDGIRARVEYIQTNQDIPSKLWQICNAVNDEVYAMNTMKDMNGGSTLICTFITNNRLYWISVGDSRIYLYRDGMLAFINEEHELENLMYQLLLDGETELSEIRETPNRELRKLTSNIGRSYLPLIDQNFIPYRLHKGDKLFLCSDGVSETLSENELLKCLESPDPEVNCDMVRNMIEKKDKRWQDNYSAIVILIAAEDGK